MSVRMRMGSAQSWLTVLCHHMAHQCDCRTCIVAPCASRGIANDPRGRSISDDRWAPLGGDESPLRGGAKPPAESCIEKFGALALVGA